MHQQIAVEVTINLDEERITNVVGSSSMRHIAHLADNSLGTIHKVLRKILRCNRYKMSRVQQLFPHASNAEQFSPEVSGCDRSARFVSMENFTD